MPDAAPMYRSPVVRSNVMATWLQVSAGTSPPSTAGSEPVPGEIRRLRITEAHDYDVVGTLLAPTEAGGRPADQTGSSRHRATRR